jgi:RNA polymerase sigma-70 factor (ECF subfamily)
VTRFCSGIETTVTTLDPPPETRYAFVMFDDGARRRLVGLCAAISGDRQAAEDLAQETLLEAWRNAHKLDDPGGADRWLAAIARNVCLRWARRAGRTVTLEEDAVTVELEHDELADLLDRALAELSADTRAALVQRYVHDLPHAEIAAALGISEDAVAMRLTRGKVVLRRVLAPELGLAPHAEPTRVWCRVCGRRTLVLERGDAIVFRCPGCGGDPSVVLDRAHVGRLVESLQRPSAILRRTAQWVMRYYGGGAGSEVACAACGDPVRVRRYDRGGDAVNRRGLCTVCEGCGIELSSSAVSFALESAAARAFARPAVVGEREAGSTVVVDLEDVLTRRSLSIRLDAETLLAR